MGVAMENLNLTKEEILNRIGFFRNKKNMSAYELGMRLGHTKNYFYRIESGEIQLTVELLLQALEILGVSTFEFFYPNLDSFTSDIEDLELIKSLNLEERKSIITLLKIKK